MHGGALQQLPQVCAVTGLARHTMHVRCSAPGSLADSTSCLLVAEGITQELSPELAAAAAAEASPPDAEAAAAAAALS